MNSHTRNATDPDLPSIVQIHKAAFSASLMTKLGDSFLSVYYELVANDANGILLLSTDWDGSQGFVAGFGDPEGFYRRLGAKKWTLFRAMAPSLIRRPWLIAQVGRNYVWTKKDNQAPAGDERGGELASLAVDPSYQGRGLGGHLVARFTEEARARGWSRIYLTTDTDLNEKVRRFYEGLGFLMVRQIDGRTRPMVEYAIELVDR